MTLRYMLDTDVVSYVVKERPPEFRRQMDQIPLDQICISAITQADLVYGLISMPVAHRSRPATAALLSSITVLDWPCAAASHFATIKHNLSTTGQRIGEMDLLIAAHALEAGLQLVTGNVSHFHRVPGLVVTDWRIASD